MHSCRRVAELLTQSMDEPLDWLDRLRLRMHLSMCDNCRNVEQQLFGVQALTAELFTTSAEPSEESAPRDGFEATRPSNLKAD
jgi:predicted anti-sigma-YlaC factor YlaD